MSIENDDSKVAHLPPDASHRERASAEYRALATVEAGLSSVAAELAPDHDLAASISRIGSALRHLAALLERWEGDSNGNP